MNYLLIKKYVYIQYFLFVNRVSKTHKRKVGLMSCLQQLPFKELSENTNLENRVLKKHLMCQKDHGVIWCLQQLPFKGLLENIKSAQKYVLLLKHVFSSINFLFKFTFSLKLDYPKSAKKKMGWSGVCSNCHSKSFQKIQISPIWISLKSRYFKLRLELMVLR